MHKETSGNTDEHVTTCARLETAACRWCVQIVAPGDGSLTITSMTVYNVCDTLPSPGLRHTRHQRAKTKVITARPSESLPPQLFLCCNQTLLIIMCCWAALQHCPTTRYDTVLWPLANATMGRLRRSARRAMEIGSNSACNTLPSVTALAFSSTINSTEARRHRTSYTASR